jgi:hypothetical protein
MLSLLPLVGDDMNIRRRIIETINGILSGQLDILQLQDGGITVPITTAGRGKIYIDPADGDLKIIFGDGTIAVLAADQSLAKYKTIGSTVVVTTLQTDVELTGFSLDANTAYEVSMQLLFHGITTGGQGIKFAFIYSGTPAKSEMAGVKTINGATTAQAIFSMITGQTHATISTTANTDGVTYSGIFWTSTSGTLDLQFAENSASANGTILESGSYIAIRKIA